MKILFVAEHFPPEIGGVASSAARIAAAISRLGHTVDIFTLARDLPAGAADSSLLAPSVALHRFGMARNLDFTLQQSLTFLEWLHEQRRLDAIWGHYVAHAGFLATWFGARQRIPVVLAARGNDIDRELFPPGDFGRLEWCLRKCQLIVAVSRDLASKIETLVDRRAVVLPNSVDSERFQPGPRDAALRARLGIDASDAVLGFSGELRAKKGLPFLLQTFRETLQRQPTRLLLIGEVRNQDRGEYERLTADPAINERIILTGHLEEPGLVAEHMRLADVMLFPSLWEGMPNSLLEAMACGVPVIASDAGAIPEVLSDRVTGLVLPRTHLHQMAQRVDELFSMPGDTRLKMIDAARAVVLREYSPANESLRLKSILESLPASGRSSLDSPVE